MSTRRVDDHFSISPFLPACLTIRSMDEYLALHIWRQRVVQSLTKVRVLDFFHVDAAMVDGGWWILDGGRYGRWYEQVWRRHRMIQIPIQISYRLVVCVLV